MSPDAPDCPPRVCTEAHHCQQENKPTHRTLSQPQGKLLVIATNGCPSPREEAKTFLAEDLFLEGVPKQGK